MPLFRRRDDGGERSAADREAARLERERRRAAREGRPLPPEPEPVAAEPPAAEEPAAVAPEPPAPEPPAAESPAAEPLAAESPAAESPAPEPLAAEPPAAESPAAESPPAEPPPAEPPAAGPPATEEPTPLAPEPAAPEPPAAQEPAPPAAEPPAAEPPAPAAPAAQEPAHVAPESPPAPEPPAPPEPAPVAAESPPSIVPEPPGSQEAPAPAPPTASTAPAAVEQPTVAFSLDDEWAATAPPPPPAPAGRGEPGRRTVSLPRPRSAAGDDEEAADLPETPAGTRRGGYVPQPGAAAPGHRGVSVQRPRRPPSRPAHRGRRLALLLLVAMLVAAAVLGWLLLQPFHGDGSGAVRVTIPQGATAAEIGDELERRGVVASGFLFSLRARLSGQRSDLRAGSYTLARDMSYAAALDALTTPPKAAPVIDVTLPEGPSRRELAPLVRRAGVSGDYLAASARSPRLSPRAFGAPRGTRTLEGFLFPATYELRRSQATARRLVRDQLAAFRRNVAGVSFARARRVNLTRYDVLTIASMIEREARVPRERRLIAAVIYNRLRQGMPLGIDATIRYATRNWSRPLRRSELERDSPYNTRRRRGLPPTPIGNPGLASIRAAAHPARAGYLFYVVKPCGDGAHNFSSTDAQFQRDVAAYDRKRAQLGGKDPSHCG